ncbi:MAG TPA: NAD(P)H-hydrate dehydratase [Candidatus Fimivivens faecavium]|nr:NAD(P)H-hydrate dehydratase [Candidatus Fimivivens faecavium]
MQIDPANLPKRLAFSDAASLLPARDPSGNKGTFGRLMLIGGSNGMGGAAALSAKAAMRSGVGLVQVATLSPVIPVIAAHIAACTYLPLEGGKNGTIAIGDLPQIRAGFYGTAAVLFGCGLGCNKETRAFSAELVRCCNRPMVIDADGLNCLVGQLEALSERKSPAIITPHMKEMSRLTGKTVSEIQSARAETAREFAQKYGVTVVLKDAATVVAAPDGEVLLHERPNSGLAKGGSGDVLAGIAASFLAQGLSPRDAAALGVLLHGEAGAVAANDLTEYAMLPGDVVERLPAVFRSLRG